MSLDSALAVCWVGDAHLPVLASASGPAIIGIRGQPDRATARARIRTALTAVLAARFDIDPSRIALHSPQGAAPWAAVRLDAAPQRIALSISHDGDISVAAYSLTGKVGIDVANIVSVPDWQRVAHDYLGPPTADALARLSAGERDAAFARVWSEHEARLKCLGFQLQEWSGPLARALGACRCFPLALPEGYAGYVALSEP